MKEGVPQAKENNYNEQDVFAKWTKYFVEKRGYTYDPKDKSVAESASLLSGDVGWNNQEIDYFIVRMLRELTPHRDSPSYKDEWEKLYSAFLRAKAVVNEAQKIKKGLIEPKDFIKAFMDVVGSEEKISRKSKKEE